MKTKDPARIPPPYFNICLEETIGYLAAQRRVLLRGKITEESMAGLGLMLIQLDYKSNDPITILINSNGGDMIAAYRLMDTMRMINSPIDGLVFGEAKSMAVDILQMCRERRMTANSTLFCHNIRHGTHYTGNSLRGLDEDFARFQRRIAQTIKARVELYRQRMGCTTREVRKLFLDGEIQQHINLTAEESLKKGLIDKIDTTFKLFSPKVR